MQLKTTIQVYFHPYHLEEPVQIGTLTAQHVKTKKAFSFEYEPEWLISKNKFLLDPEIHLYRGAQYPINKENFGVFADAMPDSWGRKLMQRRAAQKAKEKNEKPGKLYELDYLLGVHDLTRMGALRFKTDPEGPFLDNDNHQPAPPWTSLRELQHTAAIFEDDAEHITRGQLELLFNPGSSLGGARPKANVTDESGELWIAKFPSSSDNMEKAAWEYLAHLLAVQSGLNMADCKLEHIYGKHRTFFTKRFDREGTRRIHFSSAMTMTGNNEDLIRDRKPSYLEIAEFMLTEQRSAIADLPQLWRRIVFNIAISNTDDHLRNHGFLLGAQGWQLSPAFDLNPSVDKAGLGLNIDLENNDLDLDLAKSVGSYFQLTNDEMDHIIEEVAEGTANWREVATGLNIPRMEQERMAPAFTLDNDRSLRRGRGR